MIISKYGLRLERLQVSQIEMVRQWRNAEKIRNFMEYREHITSEMQKTWFASLNPLSDFYFVIHYKEVPIGLIHISDIDWEVREGNAGLFIWDDEYLGSHVPVLASLAMLDVFFGIFDLKRVWAKVMDANPVAIQYNDRLGFVPKGLVRAGHFHHFYLDKKRYFEHTLGLHNMARKVGGEDFGLQINDSFYQELIRHKLILRSDPQKLGSSLSILKN